MTKILAIETSCDETSAAVVEDGRHVLSCAVASQVQLHRQYGGVFPEMASREHMLAIVPAVRDAMALAGLSWTDLSAIAAVHGPGLAGSLLVGVNFAKGLTAALGLPLIGLNHMEGHIYANWLRYEGGPESDPAFPLICLIVSGGHTELILMHDHLQYERLGGTIDDAAGEAFDKVARLLGLQYPGGPSIERCAREGNPAAFDLPRALSVGPYDFSFSGLKTAVLRIVQDLQRAQGQEIPFRGTRLADASLEAGDLTLPVADLAASFQEALVGALVAKTLQALNDHHAVTLLVAGGVAANHRLRDELTRAVSVPVRYPPIRYCTDNAAMMGAAAYYRYLSGDRATLALDVLPGLALA
ncbi:MAG: tRNA (adenosine(37)-N6)-threonylcarbamoyltransferase complex transferase subunit TsaD [Chloroflexi bacterium]|nr:tRNA (adenosine(37)-N6)-threonylcarbamoyltransferase complex transferase subunit TsaD [Chloroflexota bacterium]